MMDQWVLSLVGLAATSAAAAAGALWFTELLRGVLRSMRARSASDESGASTADSAGSLRNGGGVIAIPWAWRGLLTVARPTAFVVGPMLPIGAREFAHKRLRRAGLDELIAAQDFWVIAVICSIVPLVVVALTRLPFTFAALATVLGASSPWIWLRDVAVRERSELARQLPAFVDMLTLALEAGGALSVALRVATDRAREGVLRRAFLRVQADIRSGRSRIEALQSLAQRLDEPSVTTLVAALIQAEAGGASLAGVLRIQSEQRLTERFTRAEKMALEAPVKMLGPLVLCIFPCTFVVLAFPVIVRFL